jgi:hypothetical protein
MSDEQQEFADYLAFKRMKDASLRRTFVRHDGPPVVDKVDHRRPRPHKDSQTITIAWSALSPCMPGLYIRIPNFIESEDLAAALLANWGVPASITVYRSVQLFRESDNSEITDAGGRPVQRHRWRRVDYSAEGKPVRAAINAMTAYPRSGREQKEFATYEEEQEQARQFHAKLAGDDDFVALEREDDPAHVPVHRPESSKDLFAWGGAEIRFDGIIYRPTNKNFAIVRMNRWHSHTDHVRREIMEDTKLVSLPSDPATTKSWKFFLCSLGHNVRE